MFGSSKKQQKHETMLSDLLCAKLCHDMANPISSISNGLEMLDYNDSGNKEIIDLINTSSDDLVNILKLYRIAYGVVDHDATENLATSMKQIAQLFGSKGVAFSITNDFTSFVPNGTNKAIVNVFIFILEILVRGSHVEISITGRADEVILDVNCSGNSVNVQEYDLKILQSSANADEVSQNNIQAYYTNMMMNKYGLSSKIVNHKKNILRIMLIAIYKKG